VRRTTAASAGNGASTNASKLNRFDALETAPSDIHMRDFGDDEPDVVHSRPRSSSFMARLTGKSTAIALTENGLADSDDVAAFENGADRDVPSPLTDDDAPEDAAPAVNGNPERYPFYTDLELAGLPPHVAAIDGVLFRNSLAAIVAMWESFKTFLALELAFCLAVGADWYGRRAAQGAVIYISAEGGAGLVKRMAAVRAKYGNFAGTIPLVIHPGPVEINDPAQVAAAFESARRKLASLSFGDMPIVAVFIDTVARNMRGDENAVQDMNAFIRGCDTIRVQTEACVVVVHHTGWGGDRGRGSSALPAALDTEIFVTRDDSRVTLKCTKQKDVPHFPDLCLESFPIAGSIAFQEVVPTSPKLSNNERRALTEVQGEPGLRSNAWMEAASLAKGSYNNARKRLLSLGYVKRKRDLYIATDAGRLALGTTDNAGTTQVQGGAP
jgi:hypothetical protein